MTITTERQHYDAMACSIGHLMESLNDGVTLEISDTACVISVSGSRFVFDGDLGSDMDTLSRAIEAVDFLVPHTAGEQ